MAPSAIALVHQGEGANGTSESNTNGHIRNFDNDQNNIHVDDPEKLYKDAYTHGYTEGYISGYTKSDFPKQIPIAIVGMSCRLPGNVTTPDEFWELCSRARSGWSEVPKERFDNASFHHPNPGKNGCFNAIGGNFLKEDLGLFDAPFFSLTAQEATSMDPQQRLLLECTFEALDSAGIPKHQIVGKEMGVFIGGSFSEYESQLFSDTETIPMHQATDTACSSSLVALHQACQSLRNGESKSAIVGGCHLNMLPEFWISMSKSRLFSDEGRSFSFDSRGTGYGRGEGCGIVILKPLDQALKDNDVIRSVIVASGINQDGKTAGITMPNGSAQEALMQSVYKSARINPRDTGYVEAHGTGTKVGDPIEAAALHNIFGEDRTARNPLFIGSVKSNIGHLEAASGIISVIKTTMMLERGFILPNYDFKQPNEKIPFTKWHLKVPINQRPWPRPKRFASINNFGFGGTNAHVVLERAPFLKENESDSGDSATQFRKLFVLSANDKSALEALMKNIGIYLEQRPEIFQNDLMSNIAYTLGQRRSFLQWRVAISAISSFDLIQTLNGGKMSLLRETEPLRIGFIFTGQGAQWNAMGRELYDQYPVFTSTIDACDRCLVLFGAPFSLVDELQKDPETSLINEAHISQPACTAIQLALTDLLKSWNISPAAVTGHSSGEIAAAYAADVLPLNSCMAISYYRGMTTMALKKRFPDLKGSMMAVGCSKEEVMPLISKLTAKEARIACFNSPSSLTISGDEPAIDELQAAMEEKRLFNRKLQVDVAYHSHHMKLVAKDYRASLQSLCPPKAAQVRFYSSLVGHLADASELGPNYWVDNLTQPVRFSEALTSMCKPIDGYKTGVNMLIEIGPHSALAGPVKQILKACGSNAVKIPYASALVRKKDAVETTLDLASTLFTKGATVDLGVVNFPRPTKKPTLLVDMPRYPWNHQTRYWHESRMMKMHKNRTVPRNDLLGTLANYSNDLEPTWRNILRIDDLPWLRHHKIQSLTLFPMSGFVAMAVEAASQRAASRNIHFDNFELRNVSVSAPLMVAEEDIEMTLQLRPHQEGTLVSFDIWDEFRIHSWAANKGWTEHCKGLITVKTKGNTTVNATQEPQKSEPLLNTMRSEIIQAGANVVDKSKLYDSLSEIGVSYGPVFQGMNNCRAGNSNSSADITTVDTGEEMPQGHQSSMIIHPALLEQLVEMYWPILAAGRSSIDTVYLPSSIKRLTISRQVTELTKMPGGSLRAFCRGSQPSSHAKPIQMSMFATAPDSSQEALILLDDLTISPILEGGIPTESVVHRELCYKLDWEPILEPLSPSATFHITPSENPDGKTNRNSIHLNGVTNGHSNGVSNGSSQKANGIANFLEGEVVIVRGDSELQSELASKLASVIGHLTGRRPNIGTLSDMNTEDKVCLFLQELDQPLLSSLILTEFTFLQNILTKVRGILWVVRGAYVKSSNPDANMVTGLSRSIRSETLLKFATLDLDSKSILDSDGVVDAILKVFKATFGPSAEANCELEFTERNGSFFTPRIVDDTEMNEYVHKQTKSSVLEPTLFAQGDRPLKIVIETPGALETLHFVDQLIEESLPNDEVEIEIKAVGMNSVDAAAIMGQLETSNFGFEFSGMIVKIGSKVAKFSVGDHVAGISVSQGVYSTCTRTKEALIFGIGDSISFEEAASIPVAFSTAYYALDDLGRLHKEERILIHGATSAVGQAAICLAQMMSAETYVSIESTEDRELLKRIYGLNDDHIFSSQRSSFGSAIRRLSGKEGFDVIINCVSTSMDNLTDIWDSLGSFGRFIDVGRQNYNVRLETARLNHNQSFLSVDSISLATERPKIMGGLISNISELLSRGKIRPCSSTIFPMSDIETAFKALQSGSTTGKLIVAPQAGDKVKATPSSKNAKLLLSNATYILIGGTGGLGRSMARWMAGKGAKNLVLVSRNGTSTGKVKDLIDELSAIGVNVAVRQCNVSNSDSVQKLIRDDLAGMPKIRGVIHGAMVLHDVLFEKMTYEQYSTVIESKVWGAWNFHNALKDQSLDFFVAISSTAGAVGNRGQAAYSAANTFLNAFIQYRLSLGLPASSLDLTAVSDAGYLAENLEAAAEVFKNLGSDTICEAEVMALLGAAIDGHLAHICNNHTITGVRITPSTPFWTTDAKFKHLRLAAEAAAAKNSSQAESISFNAALKVAQSLEEAQDVVCQGLLNILPSVLMLEKEDMDITRSLSSYALDSLVAIEVRNFITREFEANLQVLELLSRIWFLNIETMDPAEFGISTLPLQHEPYVAISSETLANTNVGKIAVVTGAAGGNVTPTHQFTKFLFFLSLTIYLKLNSISTRLGIGAAIAESIAKTGANIALLDLTAESQDGTKESCEKAGVKALAYSCDVTDLENVKKAFEQVGKDLGPIDILVNNAGIFEQRPLSMASFESIWRQVEVNFKGPLITTHMVLPGMMKRRQGCIINIASRSGTVDVPMALAYNTSKAALIRMTHTLQREMEIEGLDDEIQVYALHPGGVLTAMGSSATAPDVTEKYGIVKDEAFYKFLFKDIPALCGQTCAFLAAGRGKELRGFYLDSRQDVTKLLGVGREFLKKEQLNTLGVDFLEGYLFEGKTDGSTTTSCLPGYAGFCGGTWQGIISKLDYIQGMGFTAIWISPVVEQVADPARAYHGYTAQNLYGLNSNFGTEDDLKALSNALHNRNMYLMVDVVANHMGSGDQAELIDYSIINPFNQKVYFHVNPICWINDYNNQSEVELCWLGNDNYPLPDLNTTQNVVRDMFSTWVEYLVSTYSIDGLRVDTVKHIEKPFWPIFNSASGVYNVGEVADGDVGYVCPYQDYMDGLLAYPSYFQATQFFSNTSVTSANFIAEVEYMNSQCKDTSLLGSFTENHDQPRFAYYTDDMTLAKNIVTYTMLADGIPIIYQGQEQHFSGAADPYDREALWLTNYNTSTPLYELTTALNALRTLAFSCSSSYLTWHQQVVYSDDHNIAFRKGDSSYMTLMILSNLGENAENYSVLMENVGFPSGLTVVEVLSCESMVVDENGNLEMRPNESLPRLILTPTSLGWEYHEILKLTYD
ncbi:hypothetical protein G7Y89_g2413 [Cudoniella acicularis]|uniref:Polyketide synthase n=1 Tax=Cudoniella acicularis TaxID=354080 RepID=A0A8H4W6I9_9HELO|nr:hypothetical protein G7Y89_g2413 [Cudoniella acicularis]